MSRIPSWRLVVLGLPLWLGQAATIDYGAVDNPAAIDIQDRSAAARWTAMFTSEPDWIARQIAYLGDRQSDRMSTFIAARLLFQGDPWTRRTGEQVNPKRWQISDTDTKLALLREIRAMPRAELGDVLKHFLARETNHDLTSSALTTLWLIDPDGAPDFAVRLADPRLSNRLPGSGQAAVRQDSLRFLLGVRGVDSAETRRALDWALLQAKGGERNHALALLKRGDAPDLFKAAILRFTGEVTAGTLDDDGAAGLAIACTRLGNGIDPETATALVSIAVKGSREISAPAATALASNLSWSATVPVGDIAKRATTDTDPVVRHCLMNLLLRVNTNAGAIDVKGSAWNALSAHRERLSRWEWEQYIK